MSNAVHDQARFAAREFIAKHADELGIPPGYMREVVEFAYEMGFLRGAGAGMETAGVIFDEIKEKLKSS